MFILDCNLPSFMINILQTAYKTILVIVPVGIVLFGVIDFLKATASKDDKEISNNSKRFISRIITGLLAFFVLAMVRWVFKIIGDVNESAGAMSCAIEILGGSSSGGSNNSTTNSNTNNNSNTSNANSALMDLAQFGTCMSLCMGQMGGYAPGSYCEFYQNTPYDCKYSCEKDCK